MRAALYYRLKRSSILVFWVAILLCAVIAIMGAAAALQGRDADQMLAIPFAWSFSLIMLPVLLFMVVRFALARLERLAR